MLSEHARLRSLAATWSQSQLGWRSPFRHAAIARDGRAGDVERGCVIGVPDGNAVAVAVGVALAVSPRGQSPPAMQVSAPAVTQTQAPGSVALLVPEVARHGSCSRQVSAPEVTQTQALGSAFAGKP